MIPNDEKIKNMTKAAEIYNAKILLSEPP